ncbi:THUMP domain-containing class I SAM-dependent RNA methyltransferase [Mangrovibacterium lignilyticum]|uniref:THUMP domain-containing class I SAM-dependent RNA methyltransferase n=1 Tax=Mangrovibacterium lignilyticum TaxID=2668052 RepID=UPI0013D79678|nr:class I SAM-dependent RNA methyltransferase [Mangrovibacterium lignilyticum]
MIETYQLVATTYAGLEEVLAQELFNLQADDVQPARRAVYFTGDLGMIYRANYSLRTALKVLVNIRDFKILKVDDLYHQALKIKWEEYFDSDKTFAVQSVVFSDLFQNSMFASLKLKDAIVDRFRKAGQNRPSVDTRNPQVVVNLHIANNACTISLDSSGESLHKRGYRTGRHEAPISEVLAAGMLKLAGWDGSESLTDPMCGSGTIVIEAAMLAKNILPGEVGRAYSFQHWKNFSTKLYEQVTDLKDHKEVDFKIYGSDIDRRNVDVAAKHAEKADVDDIISLKVIDFKALDKKADSDFLIFNPPYGERLQSGDEALYNMIGEKLKHGFQNSIAWIISTNECLKSLGLKPAKKIPLYNGSLSCSFRKYELYRGSKKN